MRRVAKSGSRGFTLIEMMIVISFDPDPDLGSRFPATTTPSCGRKKPLCGRICSRCAR